LTADTDTVLVRTPNAGPLVSALTSAGTQHQRPAPEIVQIRGLSLAQVGHLAFAAGVELHELSAQRFDLEQLYFALTDAGTQPLGSAP
jgi:ABC-2 type transport system ATP-binding protein